MGYKKITLFIDIEIKIGWSILLSIILGNSCDPILWHTKKLDNSELFCTIMCFDMLKGG